MANSCELGWWIVQTTDLPRLARDRSTSTIFCAMYESRPDVGSSAKSSAGLVSTSEAKASRFSSPPEMPFTLPGTPMSVFWHLPRPSSCM